VKGISILRVILTAVIGAALVLAAFFVPIPVFYGYLPGPVRDMEKLVRVSDAQTYSSEGALYLTTVSIDDRVTLYDLIEAQFDDSKAIVMKDEITNGRPLDEVIEEQKAEMEESKQHAQEVALAALGLARPTADGVRVKDTVVDAPASGKLEPGDLIVTVDGVPTRTTCDVGRKINEHQIGDEVDVTVERGGKKVDLTIPTADNPQEPGTPFLGFIMQDIDYSFDPGLDVMVDTGKIGGPSGGLMMTLTIYDLLTPDDLTKGHQIAGTGTIACDGGVGPIGGIQQKVAGAEREGAEIFLAPSSNFEDAQAVADDIEVVKVSTFFDALEYLEGLD
jgi:PDZ domain-containing protein